MPVPTIFISHSHYDTAFCHRLRDFLRERFPDADIFLDEAELHGGDEWMRRIQREVLARPIFIVVLTRHSIAAEWVAEETNLALARSINHPERRVIPVQCDSGLTQEDIDKLAPLLSMRQIIDLTPGATDENWQRLLKIVSGEIAGHTQRLSAAQLAELERAVDAARRAHDAFASEQWRSAVRLAKYAMGFQGNERDAALWGELGTALLRIGEVDEGLAALDTALSINRSRADLWRERATALAGLGRLLEAEQAWEMALVATSGSADKLDIFEAEYSALASAREWARAERVADEAKEIAPHADSLWHGRQQQMSLRMERQQQLPALPTPFAIAMKEKRWSDALKIASMALEYDEHDETWLARRNEALEKIARDERATQKARERRQASSKLRHAIGNTLKGTWEILVQLSGSNTDTKSTSGSSRSRSKTKTSTMTHVKPRRRH